MFWLWLLNMEMIDIIQMSKNSGILWIKFHVDLFTFTVISQMSFIYKIQLLLKFQSDDTTMVIRELI